MILSVPTDLLSTSCSAGLCPGSFRKSQVRLGPQFPRVPSEVDSERKEPRPRSQGGGRFGVKALCPRPSPPQALADWLGAPGDSKAVGFLPGPKPESRCPREGTVSGEAHGAAQRTRSQL